MYNAGVHYFNTDTSVWLRYLCWLVTIFISEIKLSIFISVKDSYLARLVRVSMAAVCQLDRTRLTARVTRRTLEDTAQ